MRIEVANPIGSPTKDKGDLLENLARDFLLTQNYKVISQIRLTGTELDLLCEHKVNRRQIYVECKAYRETLSANILTNLVGTLNVKNYQEAWMVSTGQLGKDAKGFVHEWERKPLMEAQKLSIYTPERVIEALTNANLICPPPTQLALKILGTKDAVGDWLLLVNPFGRQWIMTCLSAGIPTGALVFSANDGRIIDNPEHLRNIARTDSSISQLDFEYIFRLRRAPVIEPGNLAKEAVVEVEYGESWSDYRPARPEHFVGRAQSQSDILRLFEGVQAKDTDTRVFAITGDSGMGKSSLIAKLRDQSRNGRYKNKFFVYAVDMRAAKSPSYILSALRSCLQKASQSGFGSSDTPELKITNVSDPLESESIQNFLYELEKRNQVVCLVLDQFEELYAKAELLPVFEVAQQLFLSTVGVKSNLILGFAWKSDASTHLDHPAYFMWHSLSDHRFEISLLPFNHLEALNAIKIFENEIDKKLTSELKRQIIDQSSAYPWLLKKFCIHLYENVERGVDQVELSDNAKSLFDRDLQKLSQPELICLKFTARNAPADLFEILDTYGNEIVRSLQEKRLIIQSGDRLNIYWDIFREYILTGEIPSIPLDYIPASPSVKTMLNLGQHLDHDTPKGFSELGEACGISQKTAQNVVRDLVMLGVAQVQQSQVKLDPSLINSNHDVVLQKLRYTLRRHAVKIELFKFEEGTLVTSSDIVNILKVVKHAAQHNSNTWGIYADRMAHWLYATGYLIPATPKAGWIVRDSGGVFTNLSLNRRGRSIGGRLGVFIGDTSPAQTINALELIQKTSMLHSDIRDTPYRNAIAVLRRFGLVELKGGVLFATIPESLSPKEAVWEAAYQQETLLVVMNYLKLRPAATGVEVGIFLSKHYRRAWHAASSLRTGNSIRQWAVWLLSKKYDGKIPTPLGVRTQKVNENDQGNLFDL